MESKTSIEQFLDNIDNKEVYKSKSSLVLGSILIALGIVLVVMSGKITGLSDTVSLLLLVFGAGFLIWGIVSFFFRKTKYKLASNKKDISFFEILFDAKERDKLVRIMEEGSPEELKKLKLGTMDMLKLRVAATADASFCCTQVVSYSTLEFVNVNEVRKHSPEEAKAILGVLQNWKYIRKHIN